MTMLILTPIHHRPSGFSVPNWFSLSEKLEHWQLQTFRNEQMSFSIAAIHADVDGVGFEVHGYPPNFSSQSSWQHSQRNTDFSGWLRLAATMWRCSPSMTR